MSKLLVILLLSFCSFAAIASVDLLEFDSVEQEKRYKSLINILRCPTCQNQSLADSNSIVSEDLKQIVYEKIRAGKSDEEIKAFMKQRYGEFILFKPEMSQSNWFLWLGPFIFLFAFIFGFFIWYGRNKEALEDE
ncbi:cytochrome c-type biogenesis protein [Aliikangiella sp. IMCC44359]|uniref:cytochrome c-type biogenesis protein n=1 Tax=Aliikangiella sp. IMCC44359 TaxID=3459125 RepID=UPI00403AB9C7